MVFTPAPWYHLRPNRAPGTLLVLLFDRLVSLANRRCRIIMILDLQHSAPPPIPKTVITPWPVSKLVPLPFPTGTGTLRYLNIKAGAGGRMDSGHTYRLVSYTHCPDSRGDEHGPCEHGSSRWPRW